MQPTDTSHSAARGGFQAWWAVAILCAFYIVSYIDRIILSLLVAPLKADLGVGDIELGLLFGVAFAVFYGLLGLPLARLADAYNRKALILVGVVLWSASTVASGFASAYAVLVCLRIGLAIGEAALSPAAYSMIGDMYPPEKRALPAAVYAAAGNIGGYGSYIVGAAIITLLSSDAIAQSPLLSDFRVWQLVFFAVGIPGLFLSVIFFLTTREPPRSASKTGAAPKMKEVAAYFAKRYRLYTGLFLGAGGVNVIVFAYGAWAPEFFRRTYDWSVSQAGFAFGLIGVIASMTGTIFFTFVSEQMRKRGRPDALVIATVIASAIGCSAAGLAALAPTAPLALCGLAVMIFSLSGCSNLAVISVQFIAPGRMRATAIALLFMCTTMIGLGLGPPIVAWLGSSVFAQSGGLGAAIALVAAITLPVSVALILWARKPYVTQIASELS
jgi:MFS family permease